MEASRIEKREQELSKQRPTVINVDDSHDKGKKPILTSKELKIDAPRLLAESKAEISVKKKEAFKEPDKKVGRFEERAASPKILPGSPRIWSEKKSGNKSGKFDDNSKGNSGYSKDSSGTFAKRSEDSRKKKLKILRLVNF